MNHMFKLEINEKGQVLAPCTKPITTEAFVNNNGCDIYWLGGGGIMVNSRGTVIMIDPVLSGFDMPLLREIPIKPEDVPHIDSILITHVDSDHFSQCTCKELEQVCKTYHTTSYVAEELKKIGINGFGHAIGDKFVVGTIEVTLTPVKHNWQNDFPEYSWREWKEEEYCGFWLETGGKAIWMPGDSKLMSAHLEMPQPDVILFDFSEDSWHITLDGAIKLANTYPNSELICIHYGFVDAPSLLPFNGNPEMLVERVVNPGRIHVLAPGHKFTVM